ncbi:MAG: TrkA family potassium uptake protein [Acidimicrobiales bacterium]
MSRNLRQILTGQESEPQTLLASSVLVIGLGRFGSSLAETLVELGTEVMAIDLDATLVQEWSTRLTHVREADATNPKVLRQLGATEFDVAVVAIGTGIEASILTTAALADVGVKNIWAKAIRDDHGSILERVGANHVIYPEKQMGIRVAHAVSGQVIDYFQLDEGFVLAEVRPPAELIGLSLRDAHIREKYGVTIVCVKPEGMGFTYATPETEIQAGDILVIAGEVAETEKFAALP